MALPSLKVKIGADTKEAEDGLKKVGGGLDGVSGSAERAAANVKRAVVAFASFGAIAAAMKSVAAEAGKIQTSMFRIEAIIKATGGAAGKTAKEIRSFAESLALNTLESTEGVLAAQQRLLTFRKISGDVFDRTIVAAADLSAAMGTDLSSSVVQLGRALEDPVTGLTSLTRSGTVFTESQKNMIKGMVEAGKIAEAQKFILAELERQYGGAAEAAAKGYEGAIDTLGQRFQELKLAINDSFGITDMFSKGMLLAADAINKVSGQMDRIAAYVKVGIAGFAAYGAVLAGPVVAGFVAARVATMSLAGSLVFLRRALIRTGIGALVVAVGEGVYQFTRISKAAGGFGEALGLIGDVFGEVWGRIKTGISEMGNLFEGAGLIIQGALMEAFTIVGNAFTNNVINPIKQGLNEVIAIANSFGANMTPFEITDATGQGMGPMTAFSGRMMVGNAMDAMGDLSKPLESVGKIRDLLAEMKEEGITLPDILGLGEGGGEGGKKKSLSDKLSDQEKRIAEHLNRIKALTQGTLSDKLGAWGDYFGNLQTLTGNSSKKMLKIVKAFNAAQALMDAWGAYNKALNDPTPQPWWARLAGAANVLAAGIGAVNAIKSVGEGGAAGGAVAAGGAGGASAAAAPAPMRVTLEGIQPDSILTGSIVERLLDDLSDLAGDRGFTLLRAT